MPAVISRIEVRGYRSLRHISCPLEHTQILVGANGSGKTTFLDVFGFLSELVADGFESAVSARTRHALDLFWARQPGVFEIAIEAEIPDQLPPREAGFERIRYELRVQVDPGLSEAGIQA